jgi:hypothetical protein
VTVLVDSSVWISFGRGRDTPDVSRLQDLMRQGTAAATEPVLMEVLAGARDAPTRTDARSLLTSFRWIPVESVADFEGAATVYQQCRRAGVTPRGLIDCMIVTVCLRTGVPLLTADGDVGRIAEVMPLRLDPGSRAGPPAATG